jgi:hypothetical protein
VKAVDVLSNSFKCDPEGVHIELIQWPLHREVLSELEQVLQSYNNIAHNLNIE